MKNKPNICLLPITAEEIDQAIGLYESAFPAIERRNTDEWKRLWQTEPRFYVDTIKESGKNFVGFISYWTFADFVYVEHFAITPTCRGRSIGGNAIDILLERVKQPIILEVECPADDFSRRRIAFYQKHGLTLIERDYLQPPYCDGNEWLPLLIMSNHVDYANTHFEDIVNMIHAHVYGVMSK